MSFLATAAETTPAGGAALDQVIGLSVAAAVATAAVTAAHDRALILLPKVHRLSGQLVMLMLMVAYTFTGLFLLLSA